MDMTEVVSVTLTGLVVVLLRDVTGAQNGLAVLCICSERIRAICHAAEVRNARKIYFCRENLGIYRGYS